VTTHHAAADLLRALTEAAEAGRGNPHDAALIEALRAWLRTSVRRG
jgi:crotonobetainyl-CoA:carnitine CoA-transferase CaiB-like acyl-CoA transferase